MRAMRVQEYVVIFGVTANGTFECAGPVLVRAGFADPLSSHDSGPTAAPTAAVPVPRRPAVRTAARLPRITHLSSFSITRFFLSLLLLVTSSSGYSCPGILIHNLMLTK